MSAPLVTLGKDAQIDAGVLLGYLSPRLPTPGALSIGDDALIRSGSVLYAGTVIGRGLKTGHYVIIREENSIGNDFSIWSHSIVDYGCSIGNRVKIHSHVYVAQYTTIEDEAFLAPGVVIANDPHPGCPLSAGCMRGPVIKKGAKIGINATILPFVTIGEYALVGAGSVVTRDVPPRAAVRGNPARVSGKVEDIACPTGLISKPYANGEE